jgi:hypothetical protein
MPAKIYLFGPVDDRTEQEVREARDLVAGKLTERLGNKIEILDMSKESADIFARSDTPGEFRWRLVNASLAYVTQADLMIGLFHLVHHPYVGSSIELYWGWQKSKPILIYNPGAVNSQFLDAFAPRQFDCTLELIDAAVEEIKNSQKRYFGF